MKKIISIFCLMGLLACALLICGCTSTGTTTNAETTQAVTLVATTTPEKTLLVYCGAGMR